MTHMQLQWTAAKPTLPLNGLNICDSTEVSYFYDRECCDAVDRSLLPCPNARLSWKLSCKCVRVLLYIISYKYHNDPHCTIAL